MQQISEKHRALEIECRHHIILDVLYHADDTVCLFITSTVLCHRYQKKNKRLALSRSKDENCSA